MFPKNTAGSPRVTLSTFVSAGIKALPVLILLFVVIQFGSARQKQPGEQTNWNWDVYGGEAADAHYAPLTQINKSNVNQLQIAWTYPVQDDVSYRFNPLEIDGVVYVLARNTSLVALSAASGKEIWVHGGLTGISNRGIAYWQSQDGKDRRFIFTIHGQLQEIDAQTGKSILSFGNDGYVDLRAGLGRPEDEINQIQPSSPGVVFGNLIILGASTSEPSLASAGDVRAFDVITGKKVWQFHVIPHPGDPGYDTWEYKDAWKYAGGADPWGDLSLDQKRGIVYFGTGGTKDEFFGGDRKGEGLFGSALVALDARTGKYLWSFQLVHHDVWDFDTPAAPQLTTVVHDGKNVDAVAIAGKTCFLYVLDRVTGKPIFPIVERRVSTYTDVPDEQIWSTQPFPTAPPPFCDQQFTAADIDPYLSPELQKGLADRLANDVNGPIFTPPLTRETVEIPGNQGGANWGMEAANPNNGMVYVAGNNTPAFLQMATQTRWPQPGTTATTVTPGETQGHVLYQQRCQACHGADLSGGVGPSLVGITKRLSTDEIGTAIMYGLGRMPAFASSVSDHDLSLIISYVANPETGGRYLLPYHPGRGETAATGNPGGDVVAWGGAPAGQAAFRTMDKEGTFGVWYEYPYPKGLTVPKQRYYTDYNLEPNVIAPPWNEFTAYDLNSGTIKWQVSLGASPGLLGKQIGPVVTASGLVFYPTMDAKIRAYDADTGKILWTGDLPAGAYGIPTMYQWDGREYLVVCATTPIEKPGVQPGMAPAASAGAGAAAAKIERAYVAFALPADLSNRDLEKYSSLHK